jgi:predicted enzyme related to lactoylglutathione lyase
VNSVGYFEIQSSNPAREIIFYQSVFGWEFSKEEHLHIEYYQIKTAGIQGGLLKRPALTPPSEYGTNAFTCSIQANDFEATAARILAQGGSVTMPKFAIVGWCWQGYFMDANNNVFGIFEVDEKAG